MYVFFMSNLDAMLLIYFVNSLERDSKTNISVFGLQLVEPMNKKRTHRTRNHACQELVEMSRRMVQFRRNLISVLDPKISDL